MDWYFSNMSEVVSEECERVEYVKLMLDIKNYVAGKSIGRVLFRKSKMIRNLDFFSRNKFGSQVNLIVLLTILCITSG